MSAVRICTVADIECSNRCGDGPCRRESMFAAGTISTGKGEKLTLADIESTVEKLRGLPPVKWMLVSPEGCVWTDEDPTVLLRVLAARKFGIGGFEG